MGRCSVQMNVMKKQQAIKAQDCSSVRGVRPTLAMSQDVCDVAVSLPGSAFS